MSDFDPQQYAVDKAVEYGLDPRLVMNVMSRESAGNPNATSSKGAHGYFQLMPATARELGVDINDPRQNIEGGVRYLAQMSARHNGDPTLTAAAYNAGPGAVQRHGGVPPYAETQAYVANVVPKGDDESLSFIEGIAEGDQPARGGESPGYDPMFDAIPDANRDHETAPAAKAIGDGSVVNSETGNAYSAALTKAINADRPNIDLNAEPGSAGLPMVVQQASDLQHLQPGQFYYDETGRHQVQPMQSDEGLGFVQGLRKPVDNLALLLDTGARKIPGFAEIEDGINAIGGGKTAQAVIDDNNAFLAQKRAEGVVPGKVGQVAGSIVSTLPISLAAPEAMAGSRLLSAAAQGAAGGMLLTDKRDVGGVLADSVIGGLGGAGAHAAVGTAANIIAPKVSQAVRTYIDNGGYMTPGIAFGGVVKQGEDMMAKIMPWIGQAQGRAQDSFSGKVVPTATLKHLGEELPKGIEPGYSTNAYIDGRVSAAYNDIKNNISFKPDAQYRADRTAVYAARDRLSADMRSEFDRHIANDVAPFFDRKTGVMSGPDFQRAYSKLGNTAAKYMAVSDDPAKQELGKVLKASQITMDNAVARQNPTMVEPILAARKAAQGNMLMRDASASTAAENGMFTPGRYRQAVLNFDGSADKGAFYTGDAFGQDLADAANLVRNRQPTNGSVMRPFGILGAANLGAHAGGTIPGVGPLIQSFPVDAVGATAGAGLAGSWLAYSPAGSALLRKIMTPSAGAERAAGVVRGLFGPIAPVVGGDLTQEALMPRERRLSHPERRPGSMQK